METPDTVRVVLTDTRPLPADTRCPRCRADQRDRVLSGGFGQQPFEICKGCGYEFKETR